MTTKLTLSVEKEVVQRAKQYSRETGRSLSEIFEKYLEELTGEESNTELSPKLKSLIGAVNLPKDFNEDKERRIYLENKYS